MQTSTLFRLTGLAALIGGILDISSHFIPYVPEHAGLEIYYAIIDINLLFGLLGVYLISAQRTGLIGLLGFVIASIGIASIIGPDPELFGIDFYQLGVLTITIGLLILGVSLWRAKTLKPSAIAWIASASIGIIGNVLGYAVISFKLAGLAFGAGFILAGLQLIRSRT